MLEVLCDIRDALITRREEQDDNGEQKRGPGRPRKDA
jgi:hypothetical protein